MPDSKGRKMLMEGSVTTERSHLTNTLKQVQSKKRLGEIMRRHKIVQSIGLDKPVSPWEVMPQDLRGLWKEEHSKPGPVVHKVRGGKTLAAPETLRPAGSREDVIQSVRKFLKTEAEPAALRPTTPKPTKATRLLPKTEGAKTVLKQEPWNELFWKLQTKANKAKAPEEYLKTQLRRFINMGERFAKQWPAQAKWFKNAAGGRGKLGIAAATAGLAAYEMMRPEEAEAKIPRLSATQLSTMGRLLESLPEKFTFKEGVNVARQQLSLRSMVDADPVAPLDKILKTLEYTGDIKVANMGNYLPGRTFEKGLGAITRTFREHLETGKELQSLYKIHVGIPKIPVSKRETQIALLKQAYRVGKATYRPKERAVSTTVDKLVRAAAGTFGRPVTATELLKRGYVRGGRSLIEPLIRDIPGGRKFTIKARTITNLAKRCTEDAVQGTRGLSLNRVTRRPESVVMPLSKFRDPHWFYYETSTQDILGRSVSKEEVWEKTSEKVLQKLIKNGDVEVLKGSAATETRLSFEPYVRKQLAIPINEELLREATRTSEVRILEAASEGIESLDHMFAGSNLLYRLQHYGIRPPKAIKDSAIATARVTKLTIDKLIEQGLLSKEAGRLTAGPQLRPIIAEHRALKAAEQAKLRKGVLDSLTPAASPLEDFLSRAEKALPEGISAKEFKRKYPSAVAKYKEYFTEWFQKGRIEPQDVAALRHKVGDIKYRVGWTTPDSVVSSGELTAIPDGSKMFMRVTADIPYLDRVFKKYPDIAHAHAPPYTLENKVPTLGWFKIYPRTKSKMWYIEEIQSDMLSKIDQAIRKPKTKEADIAALKDLRKRYEDWADYGLATVMKEARKNDIQYVSMITDKSVQDLWKGVLGEKKAKQFYKDLPKRMGFSAEETSLKALDPQLSSEVLTRGRVPSILFALGTGTAAATLLDKEAEASTGKQQLLGGSPQPTAEPPLSLPPAESSGKRLFLSSATEEQIAEEQSKIPEWTEEELEEYGEIYQAAPPNLKEKIAELFGFPLLGKMPLWYPGKDPKQYYADWKNLMRNPLTKEEINTSMKSSLEWGLMGMANLPGSIAGLGAMAMAEKPEGLGLAAVAGGALAGLAKRYKIGHPLFKAGEKFGGFAYRKLGPAKLRARMEPKTYTEAFKKDPLRWLGKQLNFNNMDLPTRQIFRKRFAAMGLDQKTALGLYKIATNGLNSKERLLMGEMLTKGWYASRSYLKAHKGGGRTYYERIGHKLKDAVDLGTKEKPPATMQEVYQRKVAQIVGPKREVPTAMSTLYQQAKEAGIKPKNILKVYKRALGVRKLMSEAGQQAVKTEGVPLEHAVYRANLEHYIPFIYKNKELQELVAPQLGDVFRKMTYKDRLRLNRFIRKLNMKPEDYDKLGLVLEPAGPIMKGYAQVMRDVETAKMFSKLANYSNASSSKASKKFTVKVPDHIRYGAMRGRYTTPAINNELLGYEREATAIEKFFNKALSPWKVGKVILSPTTHARNIVSNAILADLGGLPPWRVDIYSRALKSLISQDKWYKEAGEELMGGTWYGKEVYAGLGPITGRSMFDWILRGTGGGVGAWIGGEVGEEMGGTAGGVIGAAAGLGAGWKFTKHAGSLYQVEEQFFKLAKYIHNVESFGMTKQAARMDAEKCLFNYGDAPPALKWTRTYLHPFATFSYKAIPRIAETVVKHPLRIGKYFVGFEAARQHSLASLNISKSEWEHIEEVLPQYIKQGNYLLLPYRDSKGRLQMMDWTYILPWGDINEIQQRGPLGKIIANPLITMPMEIKMNRNALGMPIWYEWNSPQEKAAKLFRYMGMQMMPSLTPEVGYNWEHLHRAFEGQKKALTVPQAVGASLFGAKIKPINVQAEAKKAAFRKRLQKSQMKSELRRKLERGAEREGARKDYRENLKRLYR